MPERITQGRDYCSNLVRERDEDRWLAAQYADFETKRALLALYAFHSELRRIPAAVTEPPLGEIRLQWWREALQEIRDAKPVRAHPVVEELAAVEILKPERNPLFDAAIDAAARPLYGEGFNDVDDLADWLKAAEGSVDQLAVMVTKGDAELRSCSASAGAAFALAREGAGLAAYLATDSQAKARILWDDVKPRLQKANASSAPAILHLALTPLYLKAANPFPLRKRVKLVGAMAFGWM